MFDLPDAKRVRRSEIYSSSPPPSNHDSQPPSSDDDADSEPDAETQAKLHARLAALYAPITPSLTQLESSPSNPSPESKSKPGSKKHKPTNNNPADEKSHTPTNKNPTSSTHPEEAEVKPQEFEFRLFSAPTTTTPHTQIPIQKIILAPSEPDPFDPSSATTRDSGAFLRNVKDPRTFKVEKASGKRLEGFLHAAIEGTEVVRESKRRNWGLEVEWRVTVLKESGKGGRVVKAAEEGGKVDEDGKGSRNKPNKKRRIVLRERSKKVEAERERRKLEELRKEENEREKKTRRNREKKVKRKAKLKAGSAVTTEVDGSVPAAGKEGDNEREKAEVD